MSLIALLIGQLPHPTDVHTSVVPHLTSVHSALPAAATPLPTPVTGVPPTSPPNPGASNPATPTTPVPPAAATGIQLPNLVLSIVVWLPLLTSIFILFMPDRTKDQRSRIRIAGIGMSGMVLLLSTFVLRVEMSNVISGTPTTGTLTENHRWIESFSVVANYHLDGDGITLPMLQVASLLFLCAMFYSWRHHQGIRQYVGLLLVLETAVNGVLLAQDYLLFVLFWGLMIGPLYLLIRHWGGADARKAAYRYLGMSSVAYGMLVLSVVIMAVHWPATPSLGSTLPQHTFDMVTANGQSFSLLAPQLAKVGFALTVIAFLMTAGAVPMHRWSVTGQAATDPAIGAIIAGVITRLGLIGLLRVTFLEFPDLSAQFQLLFIGLGLLAGVWGALTAFAADDLREFIGAIGVAQVGLVLVALGGQTGPALIGAVLLVVGQGMALALLLYLAGALEDRTRIVAMTRLGGLAWRAPRTAGLWLFACFSLIGVPLLGSFAALLLIATGVFATHHVAAGAALIVLLLITGALLRAAQRVFFGDEREGLERVNDVVTLDLAIMAPLVVGILLYGALAGQVVPLVAAGVGNITTRLGGG